MPPNAAIIGTLSCTVAALVAFSEGNAVYQIAYPMPEAKAPDETAYQTPAGSREALSSITALNAAVIGTARRKFPAVT